MKKINTGLLFAFALTMIGALLVGGATIALFTDTAENNGSSFAAGTLNIDLDKQGEAKYFDISNVSPGDSGSAVVTVSNTGSLELRYKFNDLDKDGYLVSDGEYPIQFTFKADDKVLETGENGSFLILEPGQSQNITIEWLLPIKAGNDYQGQNGTVGISVYAEQTANN